MARAKRVLISGDPFGATDAGKAIWDRGTWPASWVSCAEAGTPPFVCAYRRRFTLDGPPTIRIHVSADERYELFLDGERIGRGPERGTQARWFFETYDLDLSEGEHVLVARVWSLGEVAPYAQTSAYPGFLLAAEGEHSALLDTGVADWQAKMLGGYGFTDPAPAWGTGVNLDVDGAQFPWGFETGGGDGWGGVAVKQPGIDPLRCDEYPRSEPGRGKHHVPAACHLLAPATLPPMRDAPVPPGRVRLAEGAPLPWDAFLRGEEAVTIAPNTRSRVLIDLAGYWCAYPEVVTSGGRGGVVRVLWAESLFCEPEARTKGNRDEVAGKFFVGVGDTFHPDGGAFRRFETLWWQAGRYLEVAVEAGTEALTLEALTLRETRYPFEAESAFGSDDPQLDAVLPLTVRGWQECAHETYVDCPYYEQLQYVGDTRLEALITYALTRDDRLARKALAGFDLSRLPSGLTQSRFPSRQAQTLPPFSLWWVGMVHDYARWRGDRAFVAGLLPGVRSVLDAFLARRGTDGLVTSPPGWNFVDWAPPWGECGIPPGGEGVSGILNWHLAWALTLASDLEAWVGEPELSARSTRLARELAARTSEAFWDEGRGRFADDMGHAHFSEHAQCLALLSGLLPADREAQAGRALLSDPDLVRPTIYFQHYHFEVCRRLGRMDAFWERLSLWLDLPALGFQTPFEMPEPTRSDCHGWGSHPLYHAFATLLGIRPASFGFGEIEVRPQLGPLGRAWGRMVHPQGEVAADFRADGDALRGEISLPGGTTGRLLWGGHAQTLCEGSQDVFLTQAR